MLNKKAKNFYSKMAKNIISPTETKNKAMDSSTIDVEFIMKYSSINSQVLDLGSGTGLIVNKLEPYVKSITCVELFTEFSEFINRTAKISIINRDLLDFNTDIKYYLITCFGVLTFFSLAETIEIYKKIFNILDKKGKFIVKSQFGLTNDVIVEGYSTELKQNYYAHYRHIDKELKVLNSLGFTKIEKFDIYPKHFNRWDNTHFYALVCSK